jgi:DNA-binding transcriptional MerR regulator
VQLALGVLLLATLDVDRVLTPVQVSRRLGVHIQTVQYWRDNHRGPRFFKLGRYVFYREEDVEEFERERAARGRR